MSARQPTRRFSIETDIGFAGMHLRLSVVLAREMMRGGARHGQRIAR